MPATGVEYQPGGQLQAIFDADRRGRCGNVYRKRFLGRRACSPAPATGPGQQRRQRTTGCSPAAAPSFMKDPPARRPSASAAARLLARRSTAAGRVHDHAPVDGADVALTEQAAQRRQTPEPLAQRAHHAGSVSGRPDEVHHPQQRARDQPAVDQHRHARSTSPCSCGHLAVRHAPAAAASSPARSTPFNNLTTLFPRFSGDGFTARRGGLDRSVTGRRRRPAVTTKVHWASSPTRSRSRRTEYNAYAGIDAATAFATHVRAYNLWWAQNVPYIDVPETAIKKNIYYRWWLMRFNYLDADIPGQTSSSRPRSRACSATTTRSCSPSRCTSTT